MPSSIKGVIPYHPNRIPLATHPHNKLMKKYRCG